MKTTIIERNTSKVQYPFLAQYEESFIVLFNEGESGMVIQSDGRMNPVGVYSGSWSIHTQPERWKILDNVTINFKN